MTIEVDDAFAAANRQALALAEARIAEVAGVRAVFGPAALLDISADARGNTSARPVLGRGGGGKQPGVVEPLESEGEAARQRVVRRADALGWFLTENGRRVRFFIDTDAGRSVAPEVANALAASGLGLAPTSSAGIDARPLWPDPRGRARLMNIGFSALWALFTLVALRRARAVAVGRGGWAAARPGIRGRGGRGGAVRAGAGDGRARSPAATRRCRPR